MDCSHSSLFALFGQYEPFALFGQYEPFALFVVRTVRCAQCERTANMFVRSSVDPINQAILLAEIKWASIWLWQALSLKYLYQFSDFDFDLLQQTMLSNLSFQSSLKIFHQLVRIQFLVSLSWFLKKLQCQPRLVFDWFLKASILNILTLYFMRNMDDRATNRK